MHDDDSPYGAFFSMDDDFGRILGKAPMAAWNEAELASMPDLMAERGYTIGGDRIRNFWLHADGVTSLEAVRLVKRRGGMIEAYQIGVDGYDLMGTADDIAVLIGTHVPEAYLPDDEIDEHLA